MSLDLDAVEQAIKGFMSPDNETRRTAEDRIKALTQGKTTAVVAFAGVLERSTDSAVRLFAASQLKKKIGKGFLSIRERSVDEANQLKQFLLDRAAGDPDRRVRSNVANVIAALAATIIPHPGWPELIPWIGTACKSEDPTVRVVGFTAFGLVAPSVRDAFEKVVQEVIAMLRAGIHDTTASVAASAMLALSHILGEMDDDEAILKALAVLVPDLTQLLLRMLEATKPSDSASAPAPAPAAPSGGGFAATLAAASRGETLSSTLGGSGSGVDADLFQKTLEAIDSLVSFRKAIRSSVQPIASALSAVISRRDLPVSVRDIAVTSLCDLVLQHPRIFMSAEAQQAGLLEGVFNGALELLAEAAREDDDSDDEEADEDDPRNRAIRLGDELLTSVCNLPMPPEDVYNPIKALAVRVLGDPLSGDVQPPATTSPALAAGALGALASCLGPLREHLVGEIGWEAADASVATNEVRNVLVWAARALQIGDVNVVGQACLLLAQAAENLQPYVFEHGDIFVNLIKGVLQSVTTPVEGARVLSKCRRITLDKALTALEKFCEDCEPDVLAPHLEALVPVLCRVVVGELPLSEQGAKAVITTALQALSSICITARNRLRDRQFAEPILGAVMRYFRASDDALLGLRAHSVDLLGAFVNAIGVGTFIELAGGEAGGMGGAVPPPAPAPMMISPLTGAPIAQAAAASTGAGGVGGGGTTENDGDVRRIPVIDQLMTELKEGLKFDYTELTECTIRCWSNIAEVLGGSFVVYLEDVGAVITQVLAADDFVDSDGDDSSEEEGSDNEIVGSAAAAAMQAQEGKLRSGVPTVELDARTKQAKVAGLHALGVFARACREALIVRGTHTDFVNEFNEHVSSGIAHVDDDIVTTAINTLVSFIALVAAVPDGGTAPKGLFLGHPAASLPEISSGLGKAADAAAARSRQSWGLTPSSARAEASALPDGVAAHIMQVDRCPPWTVGRPQGEDVFDDEVRAYIDDALSPLVTLITHHSSRSVVEQALNAITELTIAIGPVGINNYMRGIVEACLRVLKGTASCQRNAEVMQQLGLGDEEDDPTCANSMTIEFTLNLIETLAKAWGPDFGAAWVELWPSYAQLLSQTHPNVLPAIGTLANVCYGLKAEPDSVGAQLFEQHLQVFWVAVGEAPPEGGITSRPKSIVQNGVFGLGIMAERATRLMEPYWDRALRATAASLQLPEAPGGLIDTAVGALCRFVAARRDASRAAEVLPAALSHVPLKKESCEYLPVMDAVIAELPVCTTELIPYILRAAAGVISDTELDSALTGEFKQKVQAFILSRKAEVVAAAQTLPAELSAALSVQFIL